MEKINQLTLLPRPIPTITCDKFTKVEKYFYDTLKEYTIEEYALLNLKAENVPLRGAELARLMIGNVLMLIYEFIGLKKQNWPSPSLGKSLTFYLQTTYPTLTPMEIYRAFEFALQGKFRIGKAKGDDDPLEHYQIMDAKYLNDVLSGYVKWRYDERNRMLFKLKDVERDLETETQSQYPLNDQAIKECVRAAFAEYDPKIQVPSPYLRPHYFDWLTDIGFMQYETNWLKSKYRVVRDREKHMMRNEAKDNVKMLAMHRWFGKYYPNKAPFHLFDKNCHVSPSTTEELIQIKNAKKPAPLNADL